LTKSCPRRFQALLITLVGTTLLAPAPGAASPITDRIKERRAAAVRAQAEADRLGDALEPVIQRYNEAQIQLRGAREAVAANKRRIGVTEANLVASRGLLVKRLVEDYRSGEPDPLATVLASGSITDMLATADVLRRSELQTADLIRTMGHDRRELGVRRTQLRRDEQRADDLVRELARREAQIREGIARQRAAVRGLEREIEQLKVEERRRQERVAAEARRRLAEERRRIELDRRSRAAALAAQEDPGIGGSAPAAAVDESAGSQAGGDGPTPDTVAPPPPPSDGSIGVRAVQYAMRYLGTPYSWGGGNASGPSRGIGRGSGTVGFDCSGLTLYAYAQVGVSLGHFTGSQWNAGTRISSMSDLMPGDLVFFGGDLGHMGMYAGGGNMVHAPRTGDVVKISNITGGYYASRFRGGVRPY
jgi:cell wall-associated NlpC family hydrolase